MFSVRAALLLCLLTAPVLSFAQEPSLPPGVSLPTSGTVFVFDEGREKSALVQLHPSEIVSNSHAASNFARSIVYAGPKASAELAGLNAAVHLDGVKGFLLVRLSGDDPELMRGRVALIRLTQTADRRVVSTYSQNIFGGQRTRKYDVVPVTKTDVQDGGWVKLTPETPLTPGEYGVVFMPKDANFVPDAVYDFDVAIEAAKPER